MAVVIEQMKKEDAPVVAQLHMTYISRGFISSLGIDFVTALYEVICQRQGSCCLVAREEGKIIGFIAFNFDINRLFREVLCKDSIRFIWLLRRRLISLDLAKKVIDTVLYPWRTRNLGLPTAELLSTVVIPEARGRGIATMLVKAGLQESFRRGITKLKVLVAADNQSANKLYMKCGFKLVRQIKSHGIDSNIYVADLDAEK